MKPAHVYEIGETIGNYGITYVSDSFYRRYGKQVTRYINVKCLCGKIFETQISPLKTGNTTSCGCSRVNRFIKMNTVHGMYGTSIYRTWLCMRDRTGRSNIPNYKRYGQRGITMFPPWREDFQLFYDYVSSLPNFGKSGHTLDRINNDGNYEHGNLRWVTQHIQNTNKGMQRNNTSGYTGVIRVGNSWCAVIKYMRKATYIGQFKTKEQAVMARNNYIIQNNLMEYKVQPIKT